MGDYNVAADDAGNEGRPGLATAICAFLLVASCVGARPDDIVRGVDNAATIWGYCVGGAMTGLLLWGIAYAITIKRASRRWKIGSAVVLAAIGFAAAVTRIGAVGVSQAEDIASAKRMLTGVAASNGRTAPPAPDARSGPITRIGYAFLDAQYRDAHAFDEAARTAGAPMIAGLANIDRSSPILDHCDRIAALEASAAAHAAGFPALLATARTAGAREVANGTTTQGAVDAFVDGAAKGQSRFEEQWRLAGSSMGTIAALCRIVARRHWQPGPTGHVLFTSSADARDAQRQLDRLNATSGERQQIKDEARRAMPARIEAMGTR